MNRRDLFDDEEPSKPANNPPNEPEKQEQPQPEGGAAPPAGTGSSGPRVSRREMLRGAGAAAVAGAVVGAGAAYGLGALDHGSEATTAVAGEGISVGAPPGQIISDAVVRLNVNGADHWVPVKTHETLAEVLRRTLGLTGTNIGCDRSECSACTVMVDGVPMNSCSLLAVREEGRQI